MKKTIYCFILGLALVGFTGCNEQKVGGDDTKSVMSGDAKEAVSKAAEDVKAQKDDAQEAASQAVEETNSQQVKE